MDEQRAIPSVAETIAAFRALNTDIIHDEQYQEISTKVIQQLMQRVDTREERIIFSRTMNKATIRAPPDNLPRTGNEVATRLGRAILPAFKEKLKSFPLVMSLSNFSTPSIDGFEAVLNQFVKIDKILDEIDWSIMMIWKTWKPRQDDNPSTQHLSLFKVEKINDLTQHLLIDPFGDLLYKCGEFLDELNVTAVPLADTRQIEENWNDLSRCAASAIDDIDTLIEWIQKPALTMAKAECQKLVVDIEDFLNQICRNLNKGCKLELDEDIEILSGMNFDSLNKVNNFRREGLAILKLCRVFFNKISRSTNSQILIFAQPSIEMKCDEMKKFLKSAQNAHGHFSKYASALLSFGSHLGLVAHGIYNIRKCMIRCWQVLDYYLDSLLARNDPDVNRELIEDCQQWLKSWIFHFILATTTAMNATGYSLSEFPGPGDEQDSNPDNGQFDDDDYDEDEKDESNNQKDDGDEEDKTDGEE
ncbi:hypothetical protein PCANC_00716 [Puccinia coronata f. sp. avenae]|uniref:Uncharacterized protein n=1 Tax=Puccinia coronata f. sp. avenae TaxID=200324 RepID=A0A2N5W702_9BASI|nr:hypothetical protein PCASD_17350 [Puccinia coronata f. sp. avenae]PLW58026.1 hypothetical protein PCANC_00716 [Puccinia coronata f. sp. avenae]